MTYAPGGFGFTVVARAASVPEPGTLACLAIAALGFGIAGSRKATASSDITEKRPRQ